MKKVYGHKTGLKPNQLRRMERLYRRRTPPEYLVTPELARELAGLSRDIRRQLGLLIDRRGHVTHVIVGDQQGIVIPATRDHRLAPGRLKGLRCVHTHLKDEPLSSDDLTDLELLRLDLMAAITVDRHGRPQRIHVGHILPRPAGRQTCRTLAPLYAHALDIGCLDLINALESELAHMRQSSGVGGSRDERALLVSVSTGSRQAARQSLDELEALAASSGIRVIGRMLQLRSHANPRFLLGSGKLRELIIEALQKGASLIIFDQELNPSQMRSITDMTELKVIDRTQLILDIFSQRARSREGKLQVELAQLKYMLPRLVTKNTAMSRLTGGIGGRGPGETKLEINRRRVRQRIGRLERAIEGVKHSRQHQKALRRRHRLPIISIVGYTNAGKSTLLNTLTHSRVAVQNRLFATLDPSSRRLRFPRDMEAIITDTVGFIKDLPADLLVAFRATLEELESADLLLHVIDISNPRFENQILAVEKILRDLSLEDIPLLRVLNKSDLVPAEASQRLERSLGGTAVSALDRASLRPLIRKIETAVSFAHEGFAAASPGGVDRGRGRR